MKTPLISVLMSAYNSERFVLRAIISLIIQTLKDFEIIIIDDGSTDKTAQIIRSIEDPRIILIQRDNAGLTKSLNFALSKAIGEWIARQDADDISIYTRFENQLNFLNKNPDTGLIGTSNFILHNRYDLVNEVYIYPTTHDEITRAMLTVNPFVHGSIMVKRSLLKNNGGYNEKYRYVQDYELWTRLITQTKTHNLVAPLYIRSVHSKSSQVLIDKEPIFQEIRDKFARMHFTYDKVSQSQGENPIKSYRICPGSPFQKDYNKALCQQFLKMSKEIRMRKMPWKRLMLNGLIYYPWNFGFN